MLSIVLRPARHVWRLGKAPHVALDVSRVARPLSALAARSFSSSISKGGAVGDGQPRGRDRQPRDDRVAHHGAQFFWDNAILPSFRRFFKINGLTDIPKFFVVPTGDMAWPELAWGYRLGATVRSIRQGEAFSRQLAESEKELEELEFCYKTTIFERDWTEKVLPSLEVYTQEFGHCLVERPFIVPEEAKWPRKAWGVKLGCVVNGIRVKRGYVELAVRDRGRLDSLGFAWNHNEAVWNERILPAIQVYVEVYKDCKIPQSFTVPSEEPWPRSAWGVKLGCIIFDSRSKGTYFAYFGRDAEMLDELGLNVKLSARAWKHRVVPLLEIYITIFGDEDIPDDFVVPSGDPWPKDLWGIRLGLIVARNSHRIQGMARMCLQLRYETEELDELLPGS